MSVFTDGSDRDSVLIYYILCRDNTNPSRIGFHRVEAASMLAARKSVSKKFDIIKIFNTKGYKDYKAKSLPFVFVTGE